MSGRFSEIPEMSPENPGNLKCPGEPEIGFRGFLVSQLQRCVHEVEFRNFGVFSETSLGFEIPENVRTVSHDEIF
jgi:hypothetical protein